MLLRAFMMIAVMGCWVGASGQQGGNGSVLLHEGGDSSAAKDGDGVRVSAEVLESLNVTKADAPAPERARRAKASGAVIVAVKVDQDGRVVKAAAVSGQVLLRDAAVESVQKWTYKPYLVDGKAVSVRSTITVMFYPGR